MIYRLRHKPTGKFFKPSTSNTVSNLSRSGKLYNHGKPQWDWAKWIYIDHERVETQKSDWEIVSYELTEIASEDFK